MMIVCNRVSTKRVLQEALTISVYHDYFHSKGGQLAKIRSQQEHEWLALLLTAQLSHSVTAWIGFLRLPNATYVWSDGQPGEKQDGFWANDGLQILKPFEAIHSLAPKLCTSFGHAASDKSKDVHHLPGEVKPSSAPSSRWYLSDCEERRPAVCAQPACEIHTTRCADTGRCVPRAQLCDGLLHCQDGSDEDNCGLSGGCGERWRWLSAGCAEVEVIVRWVWRNVEVVRRVWRNVEVIVRRVWRNVEVIVRWVWRNVEVIVRRVWRNVEVIVRRVWRKVEVIVRRMWRNVEVIVRRVWKNVEVIVRWVWRNVEVIVRWVWRNVEVIVKRVWRKLEVIVRRVWKNVEVIVRWVWRNVEVIVRWVWRKVEVIVRRVWKNVEVIVRRVWRNVEVIVRRVWRNVEVIVRRVWRKVEVIVRRVWRKVEVIVRRMWRNVEVIVRRVWKNVEVIVRWVWRNVEVIVRWVWRKVEVIVRRVWKNVEVIVRRVWKNVEVIVRRVWRNVEVIVRRVWRNVEVIFRRVWRKVEVIVRGVWRKVEVIVRRMWRNVEVIVRRVWKNVEVIVRWVWRNVEVIVRRVWRKVEVIVRWVWRNVEVIVRRVWKKVEVIVRWVWRKVEVIVRWVWRKVEVIVRWVWRKVEVIVRRVWKNVEVIVRWVWRKVEVIVRWVWRKVEVIVRWVWRKVEVIVRWVWRKVEVIVRNRESSDQCGFSSQSERGSTRFPASMPEYPPFSRCVWTIDTPNPLKFVNVTITGLDIENQYDFLSVFKGRPSSTNLLKTYTGTFNSSVSLTVPYWLVTVKFSSDATIGGRGFTLLWETVPADGSGCGGELTATDTEARLNPTGSHHTAQPKCEWLLSAQAPNQLISFQFEQLDLEPGDQLTIFDGSGRNAPVITYIDGPHGGESPLVDTGARSMLPGASVKTPPVIVSSGNQLYVSLSTSGGASAKFVAKYVQGCDVSLGPKDTVLLLSPGYGMSKYPADRNCSWKIAGSSDRRNIILLPGFKTERSHDVVEVYSGLGPHKDRLLASLSGTTLPAQTSYSSLSGDFFITFQTDAYLSQGSWAFLISKDCEKLEVPHLQIDLLDSRFGGKAELSCAEGFYLAGNVTRTCWVEGRWFPADVPVCKGITCGPLPIPRGSYLVNSSGSSFGDTAHYACEDGFTLRGSARVECTSLGWGNIPECTDIMCPKMRPPRHGRAWASSVVYGTLREYRCTAPTRLVGSAYSHCNHSAQWTDEVPKCEVPECPALPKPQHGQLSTSAQVPAGESVQVVCDPGYVLQGFEKLTCLLNQTYSNSLSSCIDINECERANPCGPGVCVNLPGSYACVCPDGYTHENGFLQTCVDIDECDLEHPCSHICKNSKGSFTCECPPGMNLYRGPSYITRTGVVLDHSRSCIQLCAPLMLKSVGTIFYDKEQLLNGTVLAGTTARTVCPYGYHNKADEPAECLISGRWSQLSVDCVESRCDVPEVTTPNLRVNFSSLSVFSQATLTCDKGFTLEGNSKLFCLPHSPSGSGNRTSFNWTGLRPNCTRVECPRPMAPRLGNVTVDSTHYLDPAVFSCPCGHRLVGTSVVRCTEGGIWSAPTPSCEPLACPHPGMPRCGSISHAPGFPVGSQAQFSCKRRGFVLSVSGTTPLTCQALEHAMTSDLLPLANIKLTLNLNFKSQGIRRGCVGKYRKKLKKSLEVWFSQIGECSASTAQVLAEVKPGPLDKQPILEFELKVRFESSDSLCPCSEVIDQRLKRLDMARLPIQHMTGPQPCRNLAEVVSSKPVKETSWSCPLGLRLDNVGFPCQSDKVPVCMEDCFMQHPQNRTEINQMSTVRPIFQNTTSTPSSTSQPGLKVTKRTPTIQDETFTNDSYSNTTFQDGNSASPLITSSYSNTTFGETFEVTPQVISINGTTNNIQTTAAPWDTVSHSFVWKQTSNAPWDTTHLSRMRRTTSAPWDTTHLSRMRRTTSAPWDTTHLSRVRRTTSAPWDTTHLSRIWRSTSAPWDTTHLSRVRRTTSAPWDTKHLSRIRRTTSAPWDTTHLFRIRRTTSAPWDTTHLSRIRRTTSAPWDTTHLSRIRRTTSAPGYTTSNSYNTRSKTKPPWSTQSYFAGSQLITTAPTRPYSDFPNTRSNTKAPYNIQSDFIDARSSTNTPWGPFSDFSNTRSNTKAPFNTESNYVGLRSSTSAPWGPFSDFSSTRSNTRAPWNRHSDFVGPPKTTNKPWGTFSGFSNTRSNTRAPWNTPSDFVGPRKTTNKPWGTFSGFSNTRSNTRAPWNTHSDFVVPRKTTNKPWGTFSGFSNTRSNTRAPWNTHSDFVGPRRTTNTPWGPFSGFSNTRSNTRAPWNTHSDFIGPRRTTNTPWGPFSGFSNTRSNTRVPWNTFSSYSGKQRTSNSPRNSVSQYSGRRQSTSVPWNTFSSYSGKQRTSNSPRNSVSQYSGRRQSTRVPWNTFSSYSGKQRTSNSPRNSVSQYSGRRQSTRVPWNTFSSYSGKQRTSNSPRNSVSQYSGRRQSTSVPWNTLSYVPGMRQTTIPPCHPLSTFSYSQLSKHAPCNPKSRFDEPWAMSEVDWKAISTRPARQSSTSQPWYGVSVSAGIQSSTKAPNLVSSSFTDLSSHTSKQWRFTAGQYPPKTTPPYSPPMEWPETNPETEEGENIILKRKTSGSLWRETSDGSQRLKDFPTRDPNSPELKVAEESLKVLNCSETLGTAGSNDWRELDSKDNTSDSLTTHPLEKDQVTMVQSPSGPLPDMSSPVFTVEVRDEMSGGFYNISCIDAVHISINAKVNQLLREFTAQMGRAVCEEVPGSILQLTAGNIRFKGTLAHIYIQFSLSDEGSHRTHVESCGQEFKTYASSQLPKKFGKARMEIPGRDCSSLRYTGQEYVFSRSGWTCHDGYALEPTTFQCKAGRAANTTTPWTASSVTATTTSLASVLTVPRLTLTFTGVFSPAYHGEIVNDVCMDDSSAALTLVLSDLERTIQGRYIQCKQIIIDISDGVTLTRRSRKSDHKLNAIANCTLIARAESVTRDALTKCARFLSLEYREPGQHLPTVSLGQPYLTNTCPPIILYPSELRADLNGQVFSCPPNHRYDSSSFKCIQDSLPMYEARLEITLDGRMPKGYCKGVFKLTAGQFVKKLVSGIQTNISRGEICKTTEDVVLLYDDEKSQDILYDKFQVTFSLSVSLVSLSGQREGCVSCMKDIYTHLGTVLVQPFSRLLPTAFYNCSNLRSTRGGFTVANNTWKCHQGLRYHARTHRCYREEDVAPSKKVANLSRKRREAKTAPSVAWSAKAPQCLDMEAPVIHGCGSDSSFVTVGQSAESQGIRQPRVTDNGPHPPMVAFSPENFTFSDYEFTSRGDFPVKMTAEDADGNTAECLMTFRVQSSPVANMRCPKEMVMIYSDDGSLKYHNDILFFQTSVRLHAPPTLFHNSSNNIPLKDDSIPFPASSGQEEGIGSLSTNRSQTDSLDDSEAIFLVYEPPMNSFLPYDTIQTAVAKIIDSHGAVIQSCEFFFILKHPLPSCDGSDLEQYGVNATCVSVQNSLSCSVSCPFGSNFVAAPPLHYLCLDTLHWLPEDTVLRCGRSFPTDYTVNMVVSVTYQGSSRSHACVESIVDAVSSNLQARMNQSCSTALARGDVVLSPVAGRDIFTSITPFAVMSTKINIKISMVHRDSGNVTYSAEWCADQLRADLSFDNVTLSVSCGQCVLDVHLDKQLNQSCPPGMALVSDSVLQQPQQYTCVECPSGMYEAKRKCHACPIGSFQPEVRSTRCIPCPQDLTTNKTGASSQDQCRVRCDVDQYSPTGLAPCLPCPQWTVQPVPGSNTCEDLDFKDYADTLCDGLDDVCVSSPCVHGLCDTTPSGYTCYCHPGYTGLRCESEIDMCENNPCENNGTCDSRLLGYHCICPDGFTGRNCSSQQSYCTIEDCYNGGSLDKVACECICPTDFIGDHCEAKVNGCQFVRCENGGACDSSPDGYVCVCQAGYTGPSCGQQEVACSMNVSRCLNNGSCVPNQATVTGYSCNCPEGFVGHLCQDRKNYCQSQPCHTEGTLECRSEDYGYSCVCLPGWTGLRCDVFLDPCFSQPCSGGHVCHVPDSGDQRFTCLCPPGFEGADCSIPIDKCRLDPCSNLAECVSHGISFTCKCRPGFSGEKCEINVDDCADTPCLNGGSCHDGVDFFTCSCPLSHRGPLCEEEVRSCLSQPCRNRATCAELGAGGFSCICEKGFTGQLCENEINPCEPSPCHGGARCIPQPPQTSGPTQPDTPEAMFRCECPGPYTGLTCETVLTASQECPTHTELHCLNGGICRRDPAQGLEMCECKPHFYGPDCAKRKSPNFDVQFRDDGAPELYQWTVDLGNSSDVQPPQLTLCLWVKFLDSDSSALYLTIMFKDGSSIYLSGAAVDTSHPALSKALNTSDGQWHHLCLVMSEHSAIMYKDGTPSSHLALGLADKPRQKITVTLGSAPPTSADVKRFTGSIHGLNMYRSLFSADDIHNMSRHCHMTGGDLFDWLTLDSFVSRDLRLSMPSRCEVNRCLENSGKMGCLVPKDIVLESDRTAPVVVKCPATQVVTNEESPALVTWEEPEFSDNVKVTRVKQNRRSGIVLPYGEYLITYVAYDAENNSASCNFHVFVRKFNCLDPPPPIKGARVCGEWAHGRYCIPSCPRRHQMVQATPPFYRCGLEGTWDPGKVHALVFPVCARVRPAAYTIYGEAKFLTNSDCTSNMKEALRKKLNLVLAQLEDNLDLCPDSGGDCDYKSELHVQCASRASRSTRNKRAVAMETEYNIQLGVNLTQGMTSLTTDGLHEQLVRRIKHVDESGPFNLSSIRLDLKPHCVPGESLVSEESGECMECPVGYFSGQEDNESRTCLPCPKGYFTDQSSQTSCKQCQENLTTIREGSVREEDCVESCRPGSYYNSQTRRCEVCPPGQYQAMSGHSSCSSCPPGLSTRTSGETQVSACQDVCAAGQELWLQDQCRKCPEGTYKSQAELFCTPCPHGKTTDGDGATSIAMCAVDECRPGSFWSRASERCDPCPISTYQPEKGQKACIGCGAGYTTNIEGADDIELCVSQVVDECALDLDTCNESSVCRDTEGSYVCVCKFGSRADGQCIDACEQYCSELKPCSDDDGQNDGDRHGTAGQCHCPVKTCSSEAAADQWGGYRLVVVSSMCVSALALTLIFVTLVILAYRKHKAHKAKPEVRYYRRSNQQGFTNTAFDRADQEGGRTQNVYSSLHGRRAFSSSSSSTMRSRAALVLEGGTQHYEQQHQQQKHKKRQQQKWPKPDESRTGQSDQQQSGLWQHDRDELFVSCTGQSDQQQSGLWQHDRDELFVSRAGQSDQQQSGLWQHDRDELFVSRTGHSDQQQSGLWQHDRDEL
ncbi:hypothetical protein RRG08_022784, partial [Elysia crispata]